MQITTIGLDLAKSVFQVHGVDASGKPVIRKALRRGHVLPFFKDLAPCVVGRGLRLRSPLGTRAGCSRAHGQAHATLLREALCQARQERRG
jgi:hypothetical protein